MKTLLFLFAFPLLAVNQYSGSAYTTTFATDGTQQTLINNIETALNNTGASACGGGANKCWTTVSGHATSNLLMQSGTTSAGSLQINARFRTNTSGTNVQIYLESTDGTLHPSSYSVSTGGTLAVANGLTYTVVASKYQFLIFTTNAATSRQFVWVGMPYLSSFLTSNITQAGWMLSNAISDSDTANRDHIRNCPAFGGCGGNAPSYEVMLNSNWYEATGNTSPGNVVGGARLYVMNTAVWSIAIIGSTGYQWRSSPTAILTSDVLIAWGLTSLSDVSLIHGQIYDCIYIDDSQPIGTTSTFDSHDWYNLTNSNAGSSANFVRGGLWFATR